MHFSAKLVAATVLSTLLAGASAAQADDVSTLRQEAAALKKQNETLEKRLNKIENQQQFVQQQSSTVATPDFLAHAVTKGPADLLTGEGPLTWNGITVFGGRSTPASGYASAGLPSEQPALCRLEPDHQIRQGFLFRHLAQQHGADDPGRKGR